MTDEELDVIMRHVLVDSLRLDLGAEDDEVTFKPSLQYQRQMKSMLKDPLKWAAQKTRPMWKIIARKAAIILLIISLSFGTVMIGSPTARAAFVRWVAEWYETHIVYRYLGENLPDKMPQYGIAELPTGFEETDRTEISKMVSVTYMDGVGDVIYFSFRYMGQGGANFYSTEDSTVFNIEVNHLDGKFIASKIPGNVNTITWTDEENNIQFDIVGVQSYSDILHMAESVFLDKTSK